jgi:hypothetical protein
MRLRRSRLLGTLALALAIVATARDLPRAQVSRAPFWAQDRRPIAAFSLFNGTWERPDPVTSDPGDPYGLYECWRRGSQQPLTECGGKGGVRWLMNEIVHRHKLGYRRFMLHLPAGREMSQKGLPLPSAQWHVLDSAGIESQSGHVTTDFQKLLTPWLAQNPGVQVIIYQGLRFDASFKEPWLERGNMDIDHATVPDLTNSTHRHIVRENTLGWLNLAPHKGPTLTSRPQIGFAFDNTGLANTRDALVTVLNDPDLFGAGVRVFVSGEAIPHSLPAPPCEYSTMLSTYEGVAPWFGLFVFHREHDPKKVWKAPARSHLGFAVRNDEVDPCNMDVKLTDSQIRQDISSAYRRGFVIIHYGGRHDRFILDMYARPQK